MQAGVYFIRNTHWAHMFMLEARAGLGDTIKAHHMPVYALSCMISINTAQVFSQSGKDVENYGEVGDQALMRHLLFPYDNYAIRNHVKVNPDLAGC